MSNQLTALFGGTFDPIHNGHIRPVCALAQELKLTKVSLLPNLIPPHKTQPTTTPEQRLEMLQLAIAELPLFTIDTRELKREKPSYTIDTLQEWRQEHGEQAKLAFIIGQDSLLTLNRWHRWQELLDYCHLLVCRRPGFSAQADDPVFQHWIEQRTTQNAAILHQQPHGCIYMAQTPLETISATEIRRRLALQLDCRQLVSATVLEYIQTHQLYR